jgi:hypothetical protein
LPCRASEPTGAHTQLIEAHGSPSKPIDSRYKITSCKPIEAQT